MPDRLTKAGAAAYALVTIGMGVQAVMMSQHAGKWSEVHGWVFVSLLALVVLTGALLAAGALTRRGLIADGGPWLFRNGWLVLVGLTAVNFVVSLAGSGDEGASWAWATGPAVFLPHFVRRLEEAWYAGEAEAELELRAGRDGEQLPGS